MNATKLEKLLIEEVSGVDYPANELDGWLVMKAAARGDAAAQAALDAIGRPLVDDGWEQTGLTLPWKRWKNDGNIGGTIDLGKPKT